MGLGLTVIAPIKEEGFFRRRIPEPEEVLQRLEMALAKALDPALCELMWVERGDASLRIGLHPAEEPIAFTLLPDNRLQCEASTASAGPGYHACLVDLLEKIGPKCKLAWQWLDAAGTAADATGYHEHRDFARLQATMLDGLQALGRGLLERAETATNLKVCLPWNYPNLTEDAPFAQTLLGPRSRAWFETLVAADGDARLACGADAFPWWERALDGTAWRNYGLVLAWKALPWHAPASEDERHLYEQADRAFTRARELGATALPEAEIAEIQALLAATPETSPVPAPQGVGYYRRPLEFTLNDGWYITLPGYMYATPGERRRLIFSGGGRAVEIGTLAVESRSNNAALEERLLQGVKAASADGNLLKMQRGSLSGRAGIGETPQSGVPQWTLNGYVAAFSSIALVTITYRDPADEAWALATWQSLRLLGE
jgi:hypothetical protein